MHIFYWIAIIFLLDLLLIAFVRGADERRDRKEQRSTRTLIELQREGRNAGFGAGKYKEAR